MARRGRREVIESALRRLPDAQRVPLVLFHFDDLSYEEIARRLRVPLAKVKTDIFRARQALRRLLARQAENLTVPEPTPGLCAVWERDGAHALAA
jgi:DNA-directed RNA polymerase specialized sigma24 family protein